MFDKAKWLEKADALKPILHKEMVEPQDKLPSKPLKKGDSIVLDFGNHYVGNFSMALESLGSPPDAPALLSLKFCEAEREIDEETQGYNGWISLGWIQEERLHVDIFPQTVSLSRRYAFRYVKITVLDVSSKYQLIVKKAWAQCTTSADDSQIVPLEGSEMENKIDAIALRTLRNCMQDVFEDGLKRDRRLWIGDCACRH